MFFLDWELNKKKVFLNSFFLGSFDTDVQTKLELGSDPTDPCSLSTRIRIRDFLFFYRIRLKLPVTVIFY